mmetsp:Transcript_54377/g.122964  ORF Transcript_54377/g.122964 Transcript_54377/m.122964 type:complete len:206 (-) Transcript_54377:51-668(-)
MSRPLTDSLPCQGSCSHQMSIKGGAHQGSSLGHVAHVVVACVRDFAVAAISEETTEELLATTVGYSAATQSHHQDGDPHGSEHCASAAGASLTRRRRHGAHARHGTISIAHGLGCCLPRWQRLRQGCYISDIPKRLRWHPSKGTGALCCRAHSKDLRREKAACIRCWGCCGCWRLGCAHWPHQHHGNDRQGHQVMCKHGGCLAGF